MHKVSLVWTHAIKRITERKPTRLRSLFFVVLAVFLSVTASISIYAGERAQAAANDNINFQARLLSNTGALVADGFYTVEFNIYAQDTGGTTQWTETQALITKNGYLTASLGEVTAFGTGIDWSQEQWLSMEVNGDGEMSPRMKITAVPLAFRAVQADSLTNGAGTITASDLAQVGPSTVQSKNSSNSLLRLNQTGTGDLIQLQQAGVNILTVSGSGDLDIAKGITLGDSSLTTAGTIRWSGTDFEGYDGSDWKSLTLGSPAGSDPAIVAHGKIAGNGTNLNSTRSSVVRNSTGNYTVTLDTALSNTNYTVILSVNESVSTADDIIARVDSQTTSSFVVHVSEQDNGDVAGVFIDRDWYYTVIDDSGEGASGADAFLEGGNSFGTTAVLGTSDDNDLVLSTNGATRLTVDNTGSITVNNDLTVGNSLTVSAGGADITGNTTIDGTLSGLTGLTVDSGGLLVSAGGANITGNTSIAGVLNLNSNGITNAGSITGVGSNLTASGGLDIATGAGNDLTLSPGSGTLVLNADTLQRTASGATTLDLNDTSDTTLSILNSNGGAVADLSVEGQVTAQSFSGDGSSLTSLNASNLSTGTVSDSLLSTNVAKLDTAQTFSALQTLGAGLTVGNTASTTAGTIRWTGVDLEVYDGTQWVSLISSSGSGGSPVTATFYDSTGGATISSGSFSTINLDATLENSDSGIVGLASDVITVTEDGYYEISYSVTARLSSGTRSGFNAKLQLNSGAGYNDVPGSEAYHYGRETGETHGTSSSTVVLNLSDGDSIRVQGQGTSQSFSTIVDATNLTITKITDASSTGGGSSTAFEQGGNSFGTTAVLGTSDDNDLVLSTNGATRLTVDNTGSITVNNDLTVGNSLTVSAGGADITGNTTIDGTLSGLTGLTVDSGGLLVSAGGANITGNTSIAGVLNLNSNGITNAGSITGVGSNLTASGGLDIATGAGNDLTLSPGSGTLVLNADTLQRTASGATTLDLNDTSDTTLSILNSNGGAVADLSVEGQVTAQSFSGDGSSLTSLNASNLSTGTVSDSLLSTNVAKLDTAQTFSALQTLGAGLTVGNTASTTAGTIRFNGTDFEGYDGTEWKSLTTPSITLLEGVLAFGTVAANGTPRDVDGATITYNSTGSYTVTFDTAATAADYTVQLTVEEDATARDDINITLDNQTTTSFDVTIREGDNSTTADVLRDRDWHFIVFDPDATAGGGGGGGSSNAFEQGGNDFGADAILGTTDADDLRLVTNGVARLTISSTGELLTSSDLTVSGDLTTDLDTFLNGDITLGNAATDTLTLNADSLAINNGLNIDNDTLVIDSVNNRIGIGNATPDNTLSINTPSVSDSSAEVLIFSDDINNKALVLQGIAGQVANLFEAQDNNGNSLLAINANGSLVLGNDAASPTAGQLILNDANGSNGFTSVLGTSNLTANRAINLPDSDGTICLSSGSDCGFVLISEGTAQVDASTDNSIFINKTSGTGNLVLLQRNGTNVFNVGNNGALTLSLDSANAFRVLDSGSNPILNVDTLTGIVFIDNLQLNKISGAGLSDCTNSNQALQWDSTSQTFSCVDLDIETTLAHVVDSAGGTDVNTASGNSVPWASQTRIDTGFTHDTVTNNTRVQIDSPGWYSVKYSVIIENGGGGRINARCQVRMNGSTFVIPSTSYSYLRSATDSGGSNVGEALVQTTSANEYYEVICDENGTSGTANTVAGASWTSVEKR